MAVTPVELLARRLARARAHTAAASLDLFFVTHLPNLHYLTGFRATAGAAVLAPDRLCLLADSRYRSVADEIIAALAPVEHAAVQPVTRSVDEVAAEIIRAFGGGRLGFEAAYLPVRRFQWLTAALSGVADPVGRDRLGERQRVVKNEFVEQTFMALTHSWLKISMNPSTGDGGTCHGDSGGPHFLGDTSMVMSATVTGDPICRATDVTYRLDTPVARAFLGQFLELP